MIENGFVLWFLFVCLFFSVEIMFASSKSLEILYLKLKQNEEQEVE